VLLTFDDGFRNNAEVAAPILRKHRVPAVFFVSSRHAVRGRYLWFSYLWALEADFPATALTFRAEHFDMSIANRQRSVSRLRQTLLALTPHPAAMYRAIEEELPHLEEFISQDVLADRYAGMSAEQAGELAADPLFSVGAHTVDHPFLTRCEPAEALRQISENRQWLEAACGRPCHAIAYPSGAYNRTIVDLCRSAGFTRGYAVATPAGQQSDLALSRIGIYSESTDVLGFKVMWGPLVRRVGLPIG
jgi:peptidoglycan/xylan/chitin deacetylase (PgdA/CDA1 family)